MNNLERRDFLKLAGVAAASLAIGSTKEATRVEAGSNGPPFEQGKYQTFPRQVVTIGNKDYQVMQLIDLGTLGPDVDTIFGIDFVGDIPTNALTFNPTGKVLETRVVGIKRVDLETVQFQKALGGDRFDEHKVSEWGGDKQLDERARQHAINTARTHQKVVYIGDLGLFQKQWGEQEKTFLNRIIRAERWTPGREGPDLGIQKPNFVNPRTF